MAATISLSSCELPELPEEVFQLTSMGRYSLYKASSPRDERVVYLLRVSFSEMFVLNEHGAPIDYKDFSDICILNKVRIEDVPSPLVVSNFNLSGFTK